MKLHDAWDELKDTVRKCAEQCDIQADEDDDRQRRLEYLGRGTAYFHVLRIINELEEEYE